MAVHRSLIIRGRVADLPPKKYMSRPLSGWLTNHPRAGGSNHVMPRDDSIENV